MKRQSLTFQVIGIYFVAILLLIISCKKEEEQIENDPIIPPANGFELKALSISTADYNMVEAAYQAEKMDGEPFSAFVKSDFGISENENDISEKTDFKNSSTLDLEYKTVILIDVSFANAINIPDMKFAVKELIEKRNIKEKMAIYSFSGETNMLIDFTSNKEDLKNALLQLAPGINTRNLNQALIEVLPKYSIAINPVVKQGSVVLITGGEDNVGLSGLQDVLNARGEKTIYTFDTKMDSTTVGSGLGDISNGLYTEIDNITSLATELSDFHSLINTTINSFYKISYRSSEFGDKDNELKVDLLNDDNASVVFSFNSVDFVNLDENGVVINDGAAELFVDYYGNRSLTASTLFPLNNPVYQWTSLNPDAIEISTSNGAYAEIKALGAFNDTATIKVRDNVNGLMTVVFCTIKNETAVFQDPRDGQNYNTVKIANEWWFAENLNYETEESWYYEDDSGYEEFGRLYSIGAALTACPEGWHLPSDYEYTTLEGALDSLYNYGDDEWDDFGWRGFNIGGNLKENSGQYWEQPNVGITDFSGYDVLPAGSRSQTGLFTGINEKAYFWTSTVASGSNYLSRYLKYNNAKVYRINIVSDKALSVRCIKSYD